MNQDYQQTSHLSKVCWDNELVVYNHGSASTHILSGLPGTVVDSILSANKFSEIDVIKILATEMPELTDTERKKISQELIRQLIGMELIEII